MRRRSQIVLPALAGLLLLWGCSKPKSVSVDSIPPGATVWHGDEIIGVTPLAIPRPEAETIAYILRRSGFSDAALSLSPLHPEGDSVVVDLKRPGNLVSLQCDSRPSGAGVFLGGEFMGRTPLLLEDLKPGTVEIAFRMKNRQQASQTLELSAGKEANRIDVEMKSLTEQYYLQQIQEHPDNMHHYVDLAHHYTLENQFEKTMQMFEKGMSLLVQNPDAPDASRLWTEIDRVITEQYDYGDSNAANAARKVVVEGLFQFLRKNPDCQLPMLHGALAKAQDATGQRKFAEMTMREAWRKFRGDKQLKRLARHMKISLN